MREIYRTVAFDEFFDSLAPNVKEKVKYLLYIIAEVKVVNAKIVKKLVDADFYELRISAGGEYRVVLFAIDHNNIVQAERILLLNGFVKKSTKDYRKEIERAKHLLDAYYEKED